MKNVTRPGKDVGSRNIGIQDVKWYLRQTINRSPLKPHHQYYHVCISVPITETSSHTGVFVVVASNDKQAQDRSLDYALSMKEKDDVQEEIKWKLEPADNSDSMTSYHFSIVAGPGEREEFVNQYFKNWDEFVKTDEYTSVSSSSPRNDASFLSEWKWPIIAIPIIVVVVSILEYVSNQ